jgi:hypothetical protein
MIKGCRYGTHRVLEPKGTLPQPAQKLDNSMSIYDNEIFNRCLNIKYRFSQLYTDQTGMQR